jgi:outer membrane receptor for Fe3+-dicitrate
MTGVGFLPVHGGLLLGDEVSALSSNDRFVVTQDQRNTATCRAMYEIGKLSLAIGAAYGSGLPVEFEGSEEEAIEQFGTRVVDQVDVERGRVRPFLVVDASVAYSLGRDAHRLRIQADVSNLTNRLRVINFAGVFSGTALAAPRSVSVRLQASF